MHWLNRAYIKQGRADTATGMINILTKKTRFSFLLLNVASTTYLLHLSWYKIKLLSKWIAWNSELPGPRTTYQVSLSKTDDTNIFQYSFDPAIIYSLNKRRASNWQILTENVCQFCFLSFLLKSVRHQNNYIIVVPVLWISLTKMLMQSPKERVFNLITGY